MTNWARIHKRKFVLAAVFLVLLVGFKLFSGHEKPAEPAPNSSAEATAVVERRASVVAFGAWTPTEYRTVLGQVISDSDIAVKAELNGTIAQVSARVGDKVVAGQALAKYKTSGDPTAINYQSALSNLEVTKLSSQNSVRSAEIALDNARKALKQTEAQQDQAHAQAYESLRLNATSSNTLITEALDTVDQYVQFTVKYRFNQSASYLQIGNTNVIGKQTVKNEAERLVLAQQSLPPLLARADEAQILQGSVARLDIMKRLQVVFTNLESLIEGTALNSRISETDKQSFLADVEAMHASIDSNVATYQSSIDGAKSSRESSRLAIINAKNQVESAQASLDLSIAQAETQVIGAQNQVNLTGASTADLTVRAPITGTITAKEVRVGDLVTPGTTLFTIVNENQSKKVQAFLNQDEWRQVQNAKEITIEIDGQTVVSDQLYLSSQLNAETQKVLAEFGIPANVTLVGNLAKVRVPLGQSSEGVSRLLPFSAVSFEPDGAEVLVVDAEAIAQRRKVVVGRVVSSSIEIISGLETDDRVVEFYKRVLPGERVLGPTEVLLTEETLAANEANQDE